MNIAAEIEAGGALIRTLPDVAEYALIGSAMYQDDANDVDFVVLVNVTPQKCAVDYANALVEAGGGWTHCGEYDTADGAWTAIRRDNLNLILTNDAGFYARYKAAMEVCKALRLESKEERIAVCRIVRDGWSAEDASLYLPQPELAL